MWTKIRATDPLRLVVCDLSNSLYVDVAGAAMLAAFHRELAARGAQLRIAEAHDNPRDLLREEGLEEQRHLSVDQAVIEHLGGAQFQ